jgi:hypothetical protein
MMEPFPALPPIETRPLFTMMVEVDVVHAIGGPQGAGRRVGNVPGGTFGGDRLQGTVLPGGADWQIERGDGALLLDARIVLRTHDEALIAMTYTGIRHGPPEVIKRLARGEAVDPGAYYFRIVPSFTSADPRYEWLNRIVAIGIGHRTASGPIYQIYEIL